MSFSRYYFDMVCRLEKQRKHLQSDEALTVFDNMIEKHVNSQERVIPQENNMAESKGVGGVKDVKVVPSEPGRGESASGTLSYMAPGRLHQTGTCCYIVHSLIIFGSTFCRGFE